jgi:hypothetical protein
MPDKFIREIEEILEKAEKDDSKPSLKEIRKSRVPRARKSWLSGLSALKPSIHISAGKVLLGCLSLFLAVILVNQFLTVPGTVNLLAGIGVVFLILTYLLFFMPSSTFNYEKRWRGQPLEDRQSIREKLRRWLRGR